MYAKMGLIPDSKLVFDELEFKNVVMYNTMVTGLARWLTRRGACLS
jgi:hypothetical protein